jgi:hypothetical protein
VDLAIKGDRITYEVTARFADCLNEEKPLPYFFDVVHYEAIAEPKLKEHIDRVGIKIYAASSFVCGGLSVFAAGMSSFKLE